MENKEKQMSTSSFFSGRGSHGAYLNILRKYKLNLHFFKLSPSVVSSSNRISNFEIKIISKLTPDLHHLVNIHIIFTRSCWIDFTDSCLLFCSGCVGVYQYLIRSSREEVVDRFTVTVVSLQSRFETNQFNIYTKSIRYTYKVVSIQLQSLWYILIKE